MRDVPWGFRKLIETGTVLARGLIFLTIVYFMLLRIKQFAVKVKCIAGITELLSTNKPG